MNSHKFNSYLIRSKLFLNIENIQKQAKKFNIYYIINIKNFIDYYIDNNLFNNNNHILLTNLSTNINNWDYNNLDIMKIIYDHFSMFIYNCDNTDNEMNDFMDKLNKLMSL